MYYGNEEREEMMKRIVMECKSPRSYHLHLQSEREKIQKNRSCNSRSCKVPRFLVFSFRLRCSHPRRNVDNVKNSVYIKWPPNIEKKKIIP